MTQDALISFINKIKQEKHRPVCIKHRALTGEVGCDAARELAKVTFCPHLEGIEVDLHMTADKVLLIRHDFAVKIGRKLEWLHDLSLAEIRQVLSADECLTLADFLQKMKTNDLILDLELKQPGIVAPVMKMCRQFGVEDRVYLTTVNEQAFFEIKQYDPDLACMFGYPPDKGKNISDNWWAAPAVQLILLYMKWLIIPITDKIIRRTGSNFLSFYHKVVSPELVKFIHEQGLLCSAATINYRDDTLADQSVQVMANLLQAGFDLIKIDYPDLLNEAYKVAGKNNVFHFD